MTVQSNNPVANYMGNGVTTSFNAPSNCISPPLVILTDNTIPASPVVRTLVLNSDYTLTSVGGLFVTVSLFVAPTSSEILTVQLNEPFTQLTHWVEGDPFPAASHEAAADHAVLLAQQLQGQIQNLTTPGLTIAQILAPLASTAAGQGAALVGDTAPFAGGVGRTQHAINTDLVSGKDLGMVADQVGVPGTGHYTGTDNGIVLNAIAAAATGSRHQVIPNGNYLITTPVVDTVSNEGIGAGVWNSPNNQRWSLAGASMQGTNFVFNGVGSAMTWTYAGQPGPGFNRISDFSLYEADQANIQNGIVLANMENEYLENINLVGFANGMILDGTISSRFTNISFNNNTTGLLLESTLNQTKVNAMSFYDCAFVSNTYNGVSGTNFGACMTFVGCRWENNGSSAGTAVKYGFYGEYSGANGLSGPTFIGCYFEGTGGLADVCIVNPGGNNITVTFKNCTFQRGSSTQFAASNIVLKNTGGGTITCILIGCGFSSVGSYVPSAAFPFINADASSTVIDLGSTYSEQTSMPHAVGQLPKLCWTSIATGAFPGTGSAVSILNITGVGSKAFLGNYFVAGKTVKLTIKGLVSSSSSQAAHMLLGLGGNYFSGNTYIVPSGLASAGFEIEMLLTCYAGGAAGVFWAQGSATINGVVTPLTMASAAAVNALVTQSLVFTISNPSGVTFTVTNASIETLN